MTWCPFVQKMELQPESDSQPAIVPDQFILHSIVAPWTPQRTYEYWRDSTNLESHFGLGYGACAQFIGTQTRADANGVANRRANGHGAVSLESASNLQASDPWNDYQVDMIVKIGVWLHEEHNIPLRICRTWDDPGYGYHRLHNQWNPDAHSCPGNARVQQFNDVIFPRIKNGEVDMALSADDISKVADAVVQKLRAGDADVKRIFQMDGFIEAPTDASDRDTNPYWAFESHVKAQTNTARSTAKAVNDALTQARANGASLTEIKDALARLGGTSK